MEILCGLNSLTDDPWNFIIKLMVVRVRCPYPVGPALRFFAPSHFVDTIFITSPAFSSCFSPSLLFDRPSRAKRKLSPMSVWIR